MALRMHWHSVLVHVVCIYIVCVHSSDTDCDMQQRSLPKLVNVMLKVNESLREDVFLEDRFLTIPEGFAIELYARVPGARNMLLLPNGDVLVSQMNWENPPGTVAIVRRSATMQEGADRQVEVSTFVEDLSLPHGLALVEIQRQLYVYISESNRVARYPYNSGEVRASELAEVVVDNLPGPYKDVDYVNFMHPFKSIAVQGENLYVSLASTSNDDPNRDVYVEPKMCAIYRYDLDGKNRTLVAEGLRNAMGLNFDPRTGDLWAVVNQRDFVKYPYRDESNNYGANIVEYMDENPPEQFVRVVAGANYGWPFCNPVASESMDDLDFVPDVERNPDESVVNCSTMQHTDKGLEAHSAPLGLSFWKGDAAPAPFKDGALVALHGSAAEIVKRERDVNGNKVLFFQFQDGRPGPQYNLVDGFSPDKSYAERWGRPVATLPLPDGSLLISDDHSGSIYRLYQESTDAVMCGYTGSAHSIAAQFGVFAVVVTVLAVLTSVSQQTW